MLLSYTQGTCSQTINDLTDYCIMISSNSMLNKYIRKTGPEPTACIGSWEELAHKVREAEKSQDLLVTLESWWYSSSPSWILSSKIKSTRGGSFCLSLSPMSGEDECPSWKTGKERKYSGTQPFLFRPSMDWMTPTLIGEGILFYLVCNSMWISSRNTFTYTLTIMLNPMSTTPAAQLSWGMKLTIASLINLAPIHISLNHTNI